MTSPPGCELQAKRLPSRSDASSVAATSANSTIFLKHISPISGTHCAREKAYSRSHGRRVYRHNRLLGGWTRVWSCMLRHGLPRVFQGAVESGAQCAGGNYTVNLLAVDEEGRRGVHADVVPFF